MSAPTKIKVLPPQVAEKIAAGEVIERPSSVVKELVENSLDAGATEVVVNLEAGGKALIEIIDNGSGMSPEDMRTSVLRHATSKLSELSDLEKIRTLGFRGEALASIAAVTDLEILSRAKESHPSSSAYQISHSSQFTPQAVTFGHFVGSPHGTCISAQGLFAQIPARLKFLKSQGAEVSQVREWLERLALTHPHVGFALRSDGKSILNIRPQSESSRVRSLLADDGDYPLITREAKSEVVPGLSLRLHWLQGVSSPQTRKLIQIVNKRAVKDRMLQQAVLSAFRQALLPGLFPAVVLYLEIDPSMIDVNVHPTKTEVRFLESRQIFHAIEKLAQSMVNESGTPVINAPKFQPSAQPTTGSLFESAQIWQTRDPGYMPPARESYAGFTSPPVMPVAVQEAPAPISVPGRKPHLLSDARFVGIFFNTYLAYELDQEMVMVDQHAAHERVRYEKIRSRLKAQGDQAPSSQALLLPEAVKFPQEQRAGIETAINWLERAGFEVEIFGEDQVLFRAIPAEWGTAQLKTRLKSLIERIIALTSENDASQSPGASLAWDERLFESMASEACHSAIRAGDRLEPLEALTLVDELFQCEHAWNCPHGRPTVVRIPEGKIEEWFQRKV